MSYYKIPLNEAVQLQDIIQDKIIRHLNILKNENSIPAGRKRNFDLKRVQKEEEDLRQKIIALKLLIQEANMSNPKDEEHKISYWVFLLAEKRRQLNNLKAVPTDEGLSVYNNGIEGDEDKKILVKFDCVFNSKKINELIEKLSKECREISNKLTKLNSETYINLQFDPKEI